MKITWMGQLSLLIETEGLTLMTDPYLTDSIFDRLGGDYRRLVPLRPEFLDARPDCILLTHDHSDHLDVPSLKSLLDGRQSVPVLAGANAWAKSLKEVGGPQNYVQMTPGTEWSLGSVHIRAVPAFHSDPTAIGFVIRADGKTIYITGDTLYSRELIRQVDEHVDILITVVNGQGNNMNGADAARLAEGLGAAVSIPVHWGLFAKFADTPEAFIAACQARNLRTYAAGIYEQVDADSLLKEGNP
ncbi:MAG: MBL fold metallo-hydrolase [Faecousia sp.]